jgi:predicted nuclease of predicted toxin-antitoxin system
LAADEDFNNRILRGLFRRRPALDIVRVQDAGLGSRADLEVLAWAAAEGRVLLTHDITTMKRHAEARSAAGLPMPDVFEVAQDVPVGQAI